MINQYPQILKGSFVQLVSLKEEHFPALIDIATQYPQIWTHLMDYSKPSTMLDALEKALIVQKQGSEWPFVVIDNTTQNIIGSTRYMEIFPEHKKLEIGWTWYDPKYWGTRVNTECKYLLLKYAFETLGCVRVQLKTNPDNLRSRKAIEKIGATFEGILRKERIREDGYVRSPAYYSIIDEDWSIVRKNLENKISVSGNNL